MGCFKLQVYALRQTRALPKTPVLQEVPGSSSKWIMDGDSADDKVRSIHICFMPRCITTKDYFTLTAEYDRWARKFGEISYHRNTMSDKIYYVNLYILTLIPYLQ